MKKRTLLILILLGFAGSLMAASLNAQPMFGRKMWGPKPGDGYRLLKDYLKITPEQEKKLEEFRKARLDEAKAYREKMAKLRDEFRKLMADPKAEEKKLNNLIDEMSQLRAERMKAMLKNRKEWEKILTPEQLQKLEDLRKDFRLRAELLRIPRRPMMRGRMMMLRHRWPGGFWW